MFFSQRVVHSYVRQSDESGEVTPVGLPTPLVRDVRQRLQYTDFDDESDYIEFVVEEVLASISDDDDASYGAVDESEVENRLKSLGYME